MRRRVAQLASLDLNLILVLRELLRERNVTRAAERLGVTQPAVSAALSRLRRHFGDELLVRVSRGYVLSPLAAQLQRHPAEWRANMTQLANPDCTPVDGTDVWQLTHGELTGRRQVKDAFDFIKANTPGFGDSYIVDIAPQIGIRETRRIVGDYQLTKDDVLDCAVFPDSIGVNGWPVEAHVKGDVQIKFHRHPVGINQLPFRMIIPQVVENLYVAGRCASMTHGGQSAARVSGPCFAMGQAAGTAADLALKVGVPCRHVDYGQLRDRLVADGAYLGEEL